MIDEQQMSPDLEELRTAYRKITPPPGLVGRIVAHAEDTSRVRTWSWAPVTAMAAVVTVAVLLMVLRPEQDQPRGGPNLWLRGPPMSALTEEVPARPPVAIPSLADVSAVPVTVATPTAAPPARPDSGPQSAVPIHSIDQPMEDSEHEPTATSQFYS